MVVSLCKVEPGHDPRRIPAKAKGISDNHDHKQNNHGRNGKQKNFGILQKRQRAVAQVANVPIPTDSGGIQCIRNNQCKESFAQDNGNEKELDGVCMSRSNGRVGGDGE